MLYPIYRLVTGVAGPFIPLLLKRRTAAGKEDESRRPERLGQPSKPRPEGRLVWIHGASVGEALSVQALIGRLLEDDPGLSVLLTTGTLTSARLMEGRLPDRAFHQFVPVDRRVYARTFLDHWRPDLVIWVESEIWPNLLTEIRDRAIPAAMVNARMSASSLARWRRFPRTIRALLSAFGVILPWGPAEGEKFRALGARRIGPAGNLKFTSTPPDADEAEVAGLRRVIGDRPVWLAASTHPGEEAMALDAHRTLSERWPDLLTILMPRHPGRGLDVAALASGIGVTRRSRGKAPDRPVHVADTLGEMGLFLRLAPITFIGGSLVPHGGHNPIEAAQLGSALVLGPHMTNFSEVTAELAEAGGAILLDGPAALVDAVDGLLRRPEDRAHMAAAARAVADRRRGLLDEVVAEIAPLLDRAEGSR